MMHYNNWRNNAEAELYIVFPRKSSMLPGRNSCCVTSGTNLSIFSIMVRELEDSGLGEKDSFVKPTFTFSDISTSYVTSCPILNFEMVSK